MGTSLEGSSQMQNSKILQDWILKKFALSPSPFIVGISGAQGCGKSTLTKDLVKIFQGKGLKAATISIDDFYWTRKEQENLAQQTSNTFLHQRGYPGTHDLNLANQILNQLKQGKSCLIPRYDKSKHGGLGDRCPREQWLSIESPQDIILMEGWFLGFTPINFDFRKLPQNNHSVQCARSALPAVSGWVQKLISNFSSQERVYLTEIDNLLKSYQQLFEFFDALIYLKPKEISYVLKWRIQAEQNMRALGKEGLSDEEIKVYIQKFLPAYKLYRETVSANLIISVSADRSLDIS